MFSQYLAATVVIPSYRCWLHPTMYSIFPFYVV